MSLGESVGKDYFYVAANPSVAEGKRFDIAAP